MVARGLKRKLRHDVVELPLDSQLQSVLDISLDKFQRDQATAEPCLRRSVLITNMLRHAKTHMEACIETRIPAKRAEPRPPMKSWRESAGFEGVEDEVGEEFSLSGTISTILQELDVA